MAHKSRWVRLIGWSFALSSVLLVGVGSAEESHSAGRAAAPAAPKPTKATDSPATPPQPPAAAAEAAPAETTAEPPGPPEAEPPTPASASPAAAPAGAIDGATHKVRLRDLEQRVDELKEQIRRSHTRLSLLSDTILSGAAGGAKAEIFFENNLSGAWRLVEAVVVLDGAVQYKKTDDTGVLAAQRKIPIFSGSIPAGDHTVQVLLKLKGHGFGVFSYLEGVSASVQNDHSFTIPEGKAIELRAIAWEQGGPTTPVEQQPNVRFGEVVRALGDSPTLAPPPSAAKPATPPKK
jgi:hypothetical protein